MSNFYARYVPPSKKPEEAASSPSPSTTKRKREGEVTTKHKREKKPKLSKTDNTPPQVPQPAPSERAAPIDHSAVPDGGSIIDKYRVTESARSANPAAVIKPRRRKAPVEQAEDKESPEDEGKSRENHTSPAISDLAQTAKDDGSYQKKHAAVLSKFEKARQEESARPHDSKVVSEQPPVELHGLEPLPQPEQVEVAPSKPTYSTLPGWQAAPLHVSPELTATFDKLGVSHGLLDNLRRNGLETAFPVQAAVLPLLLDGSKRHDGDLCVSAATGSGKTLAYVLPAVESVRGRVGTKLRAVIVVPTRELVKQVRETCEICASGTSLKIATAVGSKSIKEEQDMLVAEEKIYDPEQYRKEQASPIDWCSLSLGKTIQRCNSEDPTDSIGYVTRYSSKVDLLITTPGRLVDHLRSTPGFNLDDVRWLVVDEADKLLNESYQEWIEVVVPALQSQAATQERDELLRYMRMPPPRRKVTKVLLSATMTRDVSKLNALGLYNPKMVVLEGATARDKSTHDEPAPSSSDDLIDAFHIPDLLEEAAVPVPDGSEKPLYLLQLLGKHIGIVPTLQASGPEESTSKSESDSSSESESDSSSESSDSDDSTSSEETDSSSSDSASSSSSDSGEENAANQKVNGTTRSPRALIFTRSTASATRLSRLLTLLCPALAPRIATLTRSTASSASSRRALSSFRNSKVSVLIATDRASRGLDVPGLEHVISYDVPSSALTYVHRVGRSARAGNAGHAWTLVEHREAAWFWREIGAKGKKDIVATTDNEFLIQRKTPIKRVNMNVEDKDLKARYEAALQQLGEEARNS
ncbi:P-loop containing nucleoside triphosphate hydrolase protein, partial [Aureobasidium melanogenum]